MSEFRSLLFRLIAICLVLGVGALAITHFAGNRLLVCLYSAEYATHSRAFTFLVLAAALNCLASMLATGITSARHFVIQVPLLALAAASSVIGCVLWLPAKGLVGGAEAMVFAAAVRLVLSMLVIGYLLTPGKGSSQRSATTEYCREGNCAPAV
jgi:O-antigen/teichoic acid export membrane protein